VGSGYRTRNVATHSKHHWPVVPFPSNQNLGFDPPCPRTGCLGRGGGGVAGPVGIILAPYHTRRVLGIRSGHVSGFWPSTWSRVRCTARRSNRDDGLHGKDALIPIKQPQRVVSERNGRLNCIMPAQLMTLFRAGLTCTACMQLRVRIRVCG
jgi:hypothetical protein